MSNKEERRLKKEQKQAEAKRRARRNTRFGIAVLAAAAVSLHPRVAEILENLPNTTLILATAGLALLVFRR